MSDDYCAVEAEQLFNLYASDDIKEEPVEIKDEPFDDFTNVKHEDPIADVNAGIVEAFPILSTVLSSEIKEESFVFKDEPIDAFADFKQEEPIVDIFCPTSGTARPLNNIDINEDLNEKYTTIVKRPPKPAFVIENEVKEELLEIKDEPIVYFADFKQEEPIADVFCPSTGISRALDQNDIDTYVGMASEVKNTVELRKANKAKLFKKNIDVRTCDLCGEQAFPFLNLANNPTSTQYFFDYIIELTPGQLVIANSLAKNNRRLIFCKRHYRKEADVKCDLCQKEARPFIFTPKINVSEFFAKLIQLTPRQREKAVIFAQNNLRATICRKHVPVNVIVKMLKCASCKQDVPKNNLFAHIMNNHEFDKLFYCTRCTDIFLSQSFRDAHSSWKHGCHIKDQPRNIDLTEDRDDDVRKAFFPDCHETVVGGNKHFKKVQTAHSSWKHGYQIKETKPNRTNLKCDFCAEPELPCRLSPLNTAMAKEFFTNFIEPTPVHRNKIEWYLSQQCNSRALICNKHFKKVQTDRDAHSSWKHGCQIKVQPRNIDLTQDRDDDVRKTFFPDCHETEKESHCIVKKRRDDRFLLEKTNERSLVDKNIGRFRTNGEVLDEFCTLDCTLCQDQFICVDSFVEHLKDIHNTTPFKANIAFKCVCGFVGNSAQTTFHKHSRLQCMFSIVPLLPK